VRPEALPVAQTCEPSMSQEMSGNHITTPKHEALPNSPFYLANTSCPYHVQTFPHSLELFPGAPYP
ncbi:MAG TPA: hypothetical protein DCE42_23980, partial [Myxococcales bacterium]|nr:hypothetical protein [Myxococcales bacterium]